MKIIVVAGGQGTKVWPLSRQDKPKQFQTIIGDKTSYQHNIDMLLQEFSPEDIFISTKRKFIGYVADQSPQIPLKNYIVEPDISSDRGPGEGLAFLRLAMLHPDEPFFVVQADCYRDSAKGFLSMIRHAEKLVVENRKLVTGGIKATEPIAGVDYLKLGKHIENEAYVIEEFLYRRETIKETRELIQNFHIVTHCNHLCWYPEDILAAYKKYRPDWYEKLMEIKEVIDQPGETEAIEKIYATMEKGATEEVTMHVMDSGEAMVVLLPYKWTDIGTWNSVYSFFAADAKDNHFDGKVISVDAVGNLVKSTTPGKLIAIAGVKDLVVVDTEDALLVISKEDIDKVKTLQDQLKDSSEVKYI